MKTRAWKGDRECVGGGAAEGGLMDGWHVSTDTRKMREVARWIYRSRFVTAVGTGEQGSEVMLETRPGRRPAWLVLGGAEV